MDERVTAAQALDPLLGAFRAVTGRHLLAVFGSHVHGSLARRVLDFGDMSLVIEAEPEFDTVAIAVDRSGAIPYGDGVNASGSKPWKSFIGQPFGWGWIAMNQQGYCDGVLLSFGGIAAQVLVSVVASRLKESVIEAVADDTVQQMPRRT
jgi:Family of unknown function (DUF6334)